MQLAFSITQITLSILLIISILLQQRGTVLGGAVGGAGRVYRSKRGIERVLYLSSIVLAILFVVVALASVILQ